MGGNPAGLKIGIFNEEMKTVNDCDKITNVTFSEDGRNCNLKLISCRFINKITEDVGEKIFYTSLDQAFEDSKNGKIQAVIKFSETFSSSVQSALEVIKESDETIGKRSIDIYVDKANPFNSFFLKMCFNDIYIQYTKSLMKDCGYPEKLEVVPIQFKKPIFGKSQFKGDKESAGASLMMLISFFVSSCMSLATLMREKIDGFWHRTLLSGAKIKEVVFSYIFVQSFLVIVLIIESFFIFYFLFDFDQERGAIESIIISLICGQIGIVGLVVGMFLSCFFKNVIVACCCLISISIPAVFLSGKIEFLLNSL